MEHENKELYAKYRKRMVVEGVFKAIVLGLIVGFAVDFVIAFATWFTEFNGLWVAIGVGLGCVIVTAPIFYFMLFRPTQVTIAKRLDKVADLDERLITMHELEGDTSFIATCQREDAKASLAAAASSGGKMEGVRFISGSLKLPVVIVVAVLAVIGIAMTVLTGVTSGKTVLAELAQPDPKYLDVYYVGDEDAGNIEGESKQHVLYDNSTSDVYVQHNTGWAFLKWSDSDVSAEEEATRNDSNVREDMTVTAVFEAIADADVDEEEGVPGDGEGGNGEGEGEGDNISDSDDTQSSNSGGSNSNDDTSGGNGAGSSSNVWDDTYKDGETDYRADFDYYYNLAMQYLAEGKDIPAGLRAFIETYFGVML